MKVTDEMVDRAVAAFASGGGFEPSAFDAVAWRSQMRIAIEAALRAQPSEPQGGTMLDEDFVLMPRSLSAASAERMAHFDFDDVGNSYGDAVDELWGEIIETEAREIPVLEFSNPVFHAGNNTTVRRGTKWYGREYARVVIGNETVVVRLSTVTHHFHRLTDRWLRDEHDPSCRTVAGLLAEMQRVYPGFREHEEVTVIDFTLPDYTRPTAPAGNAGGDAEKGHNDPSWSLFDRVDFALRDAGFDYDEAARIAHLASGATPDAAPDADTVRLDWLARAGDVGIGIIVDAPGADDYYVAHDLAGEYAHGKTLRDAIDNAIEIEKCHIAHARSAGGEG